MAIEDIPGVARFIKAKNKLKRAAHDFDNAVKFGSKPDKLKELKTKLEELKIQFELEDILWMLSKLESRKEISQDLQDLQIKVKQYGSKDIISSDR